MVRAGNRDLAYSRTPVTRKTAVTPLASVTSIVLPGRSAPRRKNTAGPRVLSTWPSMTDEPIWPGVAEYLYQAASPALVWIDGTLTVPSGLSPRRSSLEFTPIAGTRTEPGRDRGSEGPPPAEPVAPAADLDGCGACTWETTTTPTAAAPAPMSRAPASPASRARRLAGLLGGGAYPACGQVTTTRNPAIRRHAVPGNAAVLSSAVLLS